MAQVMREAILANAPGSRVVKAECASTLCRVVLSHDSERAQKGLGPAIAGLVPFRFGVIYDYDFTPNRRSTTLFVARDSRAF